MKTKLIAGVLAALFTTVVYASCTSITVVGPRGDMTICQTCCYQGQCTTVCY